MSSIMSFKALNNQLKLLCSFSSSLRFKSLVSVNFSKSRTNPLLCLSQSRIIFSLHSEPSMETVKEVTKQGSAHDNVAIKADGKSYSYRQLIASASRISSLIQEASQCGSQSMSVDGVHGHGHLAGARVGIVAKPSAEFVAGVLGTWLSGGVAVPLALSYPEDELVHVISDSEISMILSTEDYLQVMQNVAVKTASRVSLIPHVPSICPQESTVDNLQINEVVANKILHREKSYSCEDPALIIYTSGTTGKPKGVVHTHKSISAQVQTLAEAWEYTSADRFLHCLPLHHVHGLFNALLAPLYAGSTVEFLPKFSVRGIWQRWRESYPINGKKGNDGITVFTGVPTMYTWLIQGYRDMDPELKDSSAFAARQLRLMMCGSSALPLPVMQEWETITGHRLLERYGMTEFVMAISNPLRGERKAGTVGNPFPGVEVRILAEDESGSDTVGMGELCVRSPSLFKEYWKRPEVTKDSFSEDGFFKTGDTGKMDEDGYYIILGRTSADIMKVCGYKLSALEIESVLLEHPAIAECCVLGLPDKDYGEAVTAIVVPEAKTKRISEEESKPPISLEELCNWAKEKLAPYKLPTRMLLYDSLPRNAMGKINKKELKKKLATEQEN